METTEEARNIKTKSKMTESRYASSDEIVVDQLKLHAKNQKYCQIDECLRKMAK